MTVERNDLLAFRDEDGDLLQRHVGRDSDLDMDRLARFEGALELTDVRPGEGYHLRLDGEGPAGHMVGEGDLSLAEGASGTELLYDLTARVGGRLAGVGQRLLDSSARAVAQIGLDSFASMVEAGGEAEEPPAAPTAAEVSSRVAKEVAKDLLPGGRGIWLVAAGALLIGALALLARSCF